MNYIDILLILVVLLAIWAGWRKGFILGSINLIVWIGSLFIGFIGYPYLDRGLIQLFPRMGIWSTPVAFILTIIIARMIMALLFNTILKRTPDNVHAHG